MSPGSGRRGLAVLAAALGALLVAAGGAGAQAPPAPQAGSLPAPGQSTPAPGSAPVVTDPGQLQTPPGYDVVPPGRVRSAEDVQKVAEALPMIRRERAKYQKAFTYPGMFLKGNDRWQVSIYTRDKPAKEIGQVTIFDATGGVIEAYVGYKVAWSMARGYSGAFGRKVNSPWVWLPLTALFILPFLRGRPRMLHLDLLVLLAFGVSVAYFNDAQIDTSVPLVYPLLGYLLVRMLWVGLRTRPESDPQAARGIPLLVPVTWLAVGVIFLMGFRIGLNVTSSNVIDVGYSGVIGAQKLVDGADLYGGWPRDNEHGDTYGPINYLLYVPFEQLFPWSGKWDDLPAAHAASIFMDVAAVVLMFVVGSRLRGRALGIVLAWTWAAFPFTLYASMTNANDALVSVFLLLVLLVAAKPAARGLMAGLGGMTKFATLALAPLLATHRTEAPRRRAAIAFSVAFVVALAVVLLPFVAQGESLATVYERTIEYQAERGSPFSIWGLYGWDTLQQVWQVFAVVLALAVAVLPRRHDVAGLAACAAAVVIALQAGVTHWFYLYVVWFFPLVMVALFARYADEAQTGREPSASLPS